MADGRSRVAIERWPALLTGGATLLAVVLVLHDLGDKSLWYDEAWSVGIVDRAPGDALWRISHWEVNQSPFYAVLAGWWRIGQSETFLRLLPGAFFVLSVPAIAMLGRRLVDASVGGVASLLLACHPLVVQWGQQVRGYTMLVLLSIIATTALLWAWERPSSTRRALLYGLIAALTTYVHFYGALVVAAHALWAALQRPWPPRRSLLAAGGVYLVLVAPLLVFIATRDGDPIAWVGDTSTTEAMRRTARGLAGSGWGVLAYGLAGLAGLVATTLRHEGDGDDRARRHLPGIWLVVPVAVVTLSTLTVKPLLEVRFLICVVPAMALLAAIGVTRLPRAVGVGLLGALVFVSGLNVDAWYGAATEDWRGAAAIVAAADRPGTQVVIAPWGGVFALRYYEDRADVPAAEVVRFGPATEATARLVEVQRITSAGRPTPFTRAYRQWRDERYRLVAERRVDHIVVRTYERTPPL
jgi:uncharacterized membrane protein